MNILKFLLMGLIAAVNLSSGLGQSQPHAPGLVQQEPAADTDEKFTDYLMGPWSGKLKPANGGQDSPIPAEGVDLQIDFGRNKANEVTCVIQAIIQQIELAELALDPVARRVVGTTRYAGEEITVQLDFADDKFSGRLAGNGLEFTISGKRGKLVYKPKPALSSITTDQWRQDLAYLQTELPKRHKNWFTKLDRPTWDQNFERLGGELASLDGRSIALRLSQIVALGGDAHTNLSLNGFSEFKPLPIQFRQFSDGLFVTGIGDKQKHLFGRQVTKIGNSEASKALEAIATINAWENIPWRNRFAAQLLRFPYIVKFVGCHDRQFNLELEILLPDDEGHRSQPQTVKVSNRSAAGPMIRWDKDRAPEVPLYLRNRGENYWTHHFGDRRAVYFAYNRCMHQPGKNFSEFVDRFLKTVDDEDAAKVLIDLRHNGGGSSPILAPVIKGLAARSDLAIYVLIGEGTFSSAILNALELKQQAGAILVGSPTGGKPNHFGELNWTFLPNSQLQVFYSTKYFRMIDDDDLPSIMPDHQVQLTSDQFFSGQDPVLEFCLKSDDQ